MRCDKCHINEGSLYSFYYGKHQETQTRFGNQVTTRTHEEGSSSQQISVPLCQQCIMDFKYQKLKKSTWKSLAWLVVLLPIGVFFIVEYLQPQDKNVGGGIALFGIAALILWGLLNTPLKTLRYRSNATYREHVCKKDEAGSRLAMLLHFGDVAKKGFNRGWTPQEFAKFLEKSKPTKAPDQPVLPPHLKLPPDLSRRR